MQLLTEFGCGETMKYYLVPEGKLRLVENRMGKTVPEERKSWSKLRDQFKDSSLSETATGFIYMLRESGPVSLQHGLIMLNGDTKTAIGAHQLIKNLSDSAPLVPTVDKFLRRLRDADTSAPEANATFFYLLTLRNVSALLPDPVFKAFVP